VDAHQVCFENCRLGESSQSRRALTVPQQSMATMTFGTRDDMKLQTANHIALSTAVVAGGGQYQSDAVLVTIRIPTELTTSFNQSMRNRDAAIPWCRLYSEKTSTGAGGATLIASSRGEAGRPSGSGADRVGAGDQSQNCEGAWSDGAALAARARRRGDQIERHFAALHESLVGTRQNISAAQQLRPVSWGTTDAPNGSMPCPHM
jgi:hypothetical protein